MGWGEMTKIVHPGCQFCLLQEAFNIKKKTSLKMCLSIQKKYSSTYNIMSQNQRSGGGRWGDGSLKVTSDDKGEEGVPYR